jgi:PIN domain nuclease of toxin-antitoxin system
MICMARAWEVRRASLAPQKGIQCTVQIGWSPGDRLSLSQIVSHLQTVAVVDEKHCQHSADPVL